MNTVPFSPVIAGLVSHAYRYVQEVKDPLTNTPQTNAYLRGCGEGELAFAFSVVEESPTCTIARCKHELLLRLGLDGDDLTTEQARLKGYIAGLLSSLEEAFYDEDDGAEQEVSV